MAPDQSDKPQHRFCYQEERQSYCEPKEPHIAVLITAESICDYYLLGGAVATFPNDLMPTASLSVGRQSVRQVLTEADPFLRPRAKTDINSRSVANSANQLGWDIE